MNLIGYNMCSEITILKLLPHLPGAKELRYEWQININSLRLCDPYMRQQINYHWFRQWLVTWQAPSYYLNWRWNIVNWTLRNKLQWNLNRNSYIFIQENAFENVVWKMVVILCQPQCVNRADTLWNKAWHVFLQLYKIQYIPEFDENDDFFIEVCSLGYDL